MKKEELEKVKEEMGTQLHAVQSDLDFIMRKIVVEYPGRALSTLEVCLCACMYNTSLY